MENNVEMQHIQPDLTNTISYIRFLNAIPNSTPLDIYVNNKLVATNLAYQDFTEYLSAVPGLYLIQMYSAKTKDTPIFSQHLLLLENMIYTGALTGSMALVTLEMIRDTPKSSKPNGTCIRFMQMSPDAPDLDVLIDGRMIIFDMEFREVSNYICLDAGKHSIAFRISGTTTTVIHHPGLEMKYGNYYAGYVVGLSGENPPLEALFPLEGASYLKF